MDSDQDPMKPFRFGEQMLLANCGLTIVATLSNGYSLTKIWTMFNLKRSLYLIVFIDALLAFGCCLVSLLTLMVFLYNVELAQNRVGCNFYSLGNFITSSFGPVLSLLISSIRYSIARKGHSTQMNKIHVGLVICLMVLSAAYYVLYVTFGNYYNMALLNIFEVCMKGEKARKNTKWLLILFNGPNLVVLLLTVIADLNTYYFVKANTLVNVSQRGESNNVAQSIHKKNVAEIPLRATMLSTMLAVPYVIFAGLVSNATSVDTVTKAYSLSFVSIALNAVRNPLILFMTFKSNEENKVANLAQIREERRNLEIKEALKMKQLRREIKAKSSFANDQSLRSAWTE